MGAVQPRNGSPPAAPLPGDAIGRLRALTCVSAPCPDLDPDLIALRRTLDPVYGAALDREERYARRSGRATGTGTGRNLATEPFCGDCHAIRSPTSTSCKACGSTQPPNLSRMNPRAAHMIGQGALR